MRDKTSGTFIVIEGIDGSGKTTQAINLASSLQKQGHDVLLSREPGGSALGEHIRAIVKDISNSTALDPYTSLLLFNAARRQYIKEFVLPALSSGKVVITDRFYLSTIAFQGYAEGLDLAFVKQLCMKTVEGVAPDKVFLLNITIDEMKQRLSNRQEALFDRYDQMDVSFHERVRNGYLTEQKNESDNIELIDGERSQEAIAEELLSRALTLMSEKHRL